ncbi:haloacid dehalogenase-like hydrolase-like protein [Leishmania mexicana MHOM/GT/2001/U1103]|uniref:Haloacid dehalogenase-like hydrolase-like protein n=1 Tax=Leishmania mexicana (strain MHOM/GT/2001/U1103) TaxID=929439 RepID=E9AZV5_LEIMU|nr:haloacid dehalogenase-like hydrolase-like protein [Leishmania mexicana MHOM/GT/2001/U1103]CBZ28506.1 haloacid dehalogenase-like hydrolase-like protein [Leishmania mexicana MHOM/GT/2001/U1103]
MTSPKIKAVFVDMDGTLLDSDHLISPRTTKVIHALEERGVAFVVATGRPFPDVFGNLAKANLRPDFIITSNGARVHDAQHNIVFACDMDAESVCRLFQLSPHLREDGVVDSAVQPRRILFNVNCKDRWLTNECIPEVRAAFHPSFIYERADPMAHTAETLKGTHSMWIRGAHADLLCVKKYVDRELSHEIGCTFALPHILDCFSKGIDKGVAMDNVCKRLGIDLRETIAFGDGMNDIPMLTAAGQSFVMANAAEMVKQAAPELPVIPSNNEEGVACKLEELLATDAFVR